MWGQKGFLEGRGFVDMWRPLLDLSHSELDVRSWALTEWMRCGCVNACFNLRVMSQCQILQIKLK